MASIAGSSASCTGCGVALSKSNKEVQCRLCGKHTCKPCVAKTTLSSGVVVESCSPCGIKLEAEQQRRADDAAKNNLLRAEQLQRQIEEKLQKPSRDEAILARHLPPVAKRAPPPLPPRTRPPAQDTAQPDLALQFPEVPTGLPQAPAKAPAAGTSSDRDLRERLDQIRGKPPGPRADEEELAERLARLTGKQNILAPRAATSLTAGDMRTDEEKIQELIAQAAADAKLSMSSVAPDCTGSAQCRASRDTASSAVDSDPDTDDEVNKLLKEVADMKRLGLLDEAAGSTTQSKNKKKGVRGSRKKPTQQESDISTESEDATEDDSEAERNCPWCTICNDDATLKCERCKELFCKACFKEMHRQDPSIAHHKAVAFRPPKH